MVYLQVDGIIEDADLYAKHKAAATAALTAFNHAAMGEPELVKEFEERLNKGRAAATLCVTCKCTGVRIEQHWQPVVFSKWRKQS